MAQHASVQYVQFYTEGSAARRILPVIKPLIAQLPKLHRRKVLRIHVDPVAMLGTVVAVCMLIMMAVGVNQLQAKQQQTELLEQKVAQLQMENRILEAEYAAKCDLEEIERTALALGMIPQQSASHTTITVELPQEEAPVSLWNRIGTFLTGLFA